MYVNKLLLACALLLICWQGFSLRSRSRQAKLLLHMYFEMSDWVSALCAYMDRSARETPVQPWLQQEFAEHNATKWKELVRNNHIELRKAGLGPTSQDDNLEVVHRKIRHGIPFEDDGLT